MHTHERSHESSSTLLIPIHHSFLFEYASHITTTLSYTLAIYTFTIVQKQIISSPLLMFEDYYLGTLPDEQDEDEYGFVDEETFVDGSDPEPPLEAPPINSDNAEEEDSDDQDASGYQSTFGKSSTKEWSGYHDSTEILDDDDEEHVGGDEIETPMSPVAGVAPAERQRVTVCRKSFTTFLRGPHVKVYMSTENCSFGPHKTCLR